jgi:hypothetical protein
VKTTTLLAFLLAPVAVGCISHAPPPKRVELYALTGAPPARVVNVTSTDKAHEVKVSSGVAFAVSVWDDCGVPDEPPPTIEIGDPSVVRFLPLSRNTSHREWVFVAEKPGATTLTLKSPCATQNYAVTVVAP